MSRQPKDENNNAIPILPLKPSGGQKVTVAAGSARSTAVTTQAITVNITNINEAPAITSSATFSADENQTSIGSVSASDPDGDSLTYSISGSEINISSSGVLTFVAAPDYETKSSYSFTVTATDAGGISSATTVTFSITNLDEVA